MLGTFSVLSSLFPFILPRKRHVSGEDQQNRRKETNEDSARKRPRRGKKERSDRRDDQKKTSVVNKRMTTKRQKRRKGIAGSPSGAERKIQTIYREKDKKKNEGTR